MIISESPNGLTYLIKSSNSGYDAALFACDASWTIYNKEWQNEYSYTHTPSLFHSNRWTGKNNN